MSVDPIEGPPDGGSVQVVEFDGLGVEKRVLVDDTTRLPTDAETS